MKNRLKRCLFSPRRTWTSTGDQGRVLMKQAASGEILDLIQSFILFMENWFFNQSAWCGLTKNIHGGKRRKLQGLPTYHSLLTYLLVICTGVWLDVSLLGAAGAQGHSWVPWKPKGNVLPRNLCKRTDGLEQVVNCRELIQFPSQLAIKLYFTFGG